MNIQDKLSRFARLTRPVVGLQVTPHAAYAVALDEHEGQTQVIGVHSQDFRTEGFLDETDFAAHLPAWLAELGLQHADLILGIPQDVTTVQILDFPPNSEKSLDSMVGLQTAQLAELSEESFTYDYAVMPPATDHPVPVLVGVCLEAFIKDRLDHYNKPGVNLSDLGMDSVGLVNACASLKPEALQESAPQLILDMGAESTTIILLGQARVLYAGWLNVGATHYTAALAEKYDTDAEKVLNTPDRYRITQKDGRADDPVARVNRLFTNELQAAFEQWQDQTEEDVKPKDIVRTYLTGHGAPLAGLLTFIERTLACDVEILQLAMPTPRGDAAAFTAAYGLALQGHGAGLLSISLAPHQTRWAARRKRRTGILAAGTALLVLLLTTAFFNGFVRNKDRERLLENQLEKLKNCERIINRLDGTLARLTAVEKSQIPLVEHGSRSRRFAATLDRLSEVRGPEDWFIYVGDAHSFEAGKQFTKEELRGHNRTGTRTANRKTTGSLAIFVPPDTSPSSSQSETARRPGRNVDEMVPLSDMIAAGNTLLQPQEQLKPVREIVRKLNDTDLFTGVDWLQSSFLRGREGIFAPWQKYLLQARNNGKATDRRYTDFTLQLPFSTTILTENSDGN